MRKRKKRGKRTDVTHVSRQKGGKDVTVGLAAAAATAAGWGAQRWVLGVGCWEPGAGIRGGLELGCWCRLGGPGWFTRHLRGDWTGQWPKPPQAGPAARDMHEWEHQVWNGIYYCIQFHAVPLGQCTSRRYYVSHVSHVSHNRSCLLMRPHRAVRCGSICRLTHEYIIVCLSILMKSIHSVHRLFVPKANNHSAINLVATFHSLLCPCPCHQHWDSSIILDRPGLFENWLGGRTTSYDCHFGKRSGYYHTGGRISGLDSRVLTQVSYPRA